MKQLVKERARELGFDDCRITSATVPDSGPHFLKWLERGEHGTMAYLERNSAKRVDPQKVLPGARSIVCLAIAYSHAVPGQVPAGAGRVAAYAANADYHEVVGERLRMLAQDIDQWAGVTSRSLYYIDTGPVLERDFAQRAGLGFIGKHTNLISRKMGNWLLLSEILTTADMDPDPPERNRCGSCVRCLDACPTSAIRAPFQLDARRCISYLTIELREAIPLELREAIGNRIFGCDDCLAVCPWNRFAQAGSEMMGATSRADLKTPNLCALLQLDEAGFRRMFAGTPIVRAKRRGLLRNVCVALGNVGDASALPVLEKAAADSESLVAEHAIWAIERIRNRTQAK
jgi:epoxyqueuosine reductase